MFLAPASNTARVRPADAPAQTPEATQQPSAESTGNGLCSNVETLSEESTPRDNLCFVCFDGDAPRSQCACVNAHVHDKCLERWLQQSGNVKCSVCKADYANVIIEHTVHSRLNRFVCLTYLFSLYLLLLIGCSVLLLCEFYFNDMHAITLYCGIFFLALIPFVLWLSRRTARRARLEGWKIRTRVTKTHPKVGIVGKCLPSAPTPRTQPALAC